MSISRARGLVPLASALLACSKAAPPPTPPGARVTPAPAVATSPKEAALPDLKTYREAQKAA